VTRFTLRHIGGPTALLEIGGVRLLTDPTFDPPGEYPIGSRVLTKLTPPAIGLDELGGAVDCVLLSHDRHPDNLDRLGRECVLSAPLALSTASAADRLGPPVRALANWEVVDCGPCASPLYRRNMARTAPCI
jgi:hypothetical protein